MDLIGTTLATLFENLALDEALLLEAESGRGGEVLRLWEWPRPAVVLGAGGRIEDDVNVTACDTDGVPLARRSSGGGTVLLGPGCLLYSLVLRYERAAELRDIRRSYHWILGRTSGALPGVTLAGPSDLAVGDRKIGGSAQQRKRDHLLHHGSILYTFDLPLIGRYLKEPPRQPDYRGRRPHGEFVMNVTVGETELRHRLAAAWAAKPMDRPLPTELVAKLMTERYSSPDWLYRH
ncbi:MAG TPA: lipoate--protein ligase family protein [Gemmataceae bacterium]|nr:lipoate--protein ligase family protein [Gemmataceae bacterium]